MPRPLPPPPTLLALAGRQHGLVTTAQCRAAGMSRDRVARATATAGWARITRGVYDTDPTPVRSRPLDHRRRRSAWAAMLAFGPRSISVGTCALALLGVAGLPSRLQPQAALPGGRAALSRDGIELRMFDDGMSVQVVEGRFVATPEWALAQAVPELERRNAVAVMDSALHQGLVTPQELDRAHDKARGRRGVARTHAWWDMADGRAESPLETFARLDCADGGVPPDRLQVVLRDDAGRIVARGDLGWSLGAGRWLIAEMDGAEFHDTPEAVFADRSRQNLLVASGRVVVLRFTARDVAAPGTIAREVRAALRALRTQVPNPRSVRAPGDVV